MLYKPPTITCLDAIVTSLECQSKCCNVTRMSIKGLVTNQKPAWRHALVGPATRQKVSEVLITPSDHLGTLRYPLPTPPLGSPAPPSWAQPIRKPDMGHVVQMDQLALSNNDVELSIKGMHVARAGSANQSVDDIMGWWRHWRGCCHGSGDVMGWWRHPKVTSWMDLGVGPCHPNPLPLTLTLRNTRLLYMKTNPNAHPCGKAKT